MLADEMGLGKTAQAIAMLDHLRAHEQVPPAWLAASLGGWVAGWLGGWVAGWVAGWLAGFMWVGGWHWLIG